MKEYVTAINQEDHGVEIRLGEGIEKDKVDRMAAKCGPNGTGCNSDCCDADFQAKIEGIDVSGVDDDVTMHLRGAVTATKVQDIMSRCNCYNEA